MLATGVLLLVAVLLGARWEHWVMAPSIRAFPSTCAPLRRHPTIPSPLSGQRTRSWTTRLPRGLERAGPALRGSVFDFRLEGERLCVNPLTWRHDERAADAEPARERCNPAS